MWKTACFSTRRTRTSASERTNFDSSSSQMPGPSPHSPLGPCGRRSILIAGVVHDLFLLTIKSRRFAKRCSSSRESVDRHFEILDDGIALVLVFEGGLARAGKRVLRHVEHLTNADRLPLADEGLAPLGDEERLHEFPRHRRIEELARLRLVPQLDDPLLLAEGDVGQRARADLQRRVSCQPTRSSRPHERAARSCRGSSCL